MPKDKENEEYEYTTEQPEYIYYEQRITQKVNHYYLYGAIGEPQHYVGMVHHLLHATPGEKFHIHLNTHGGNLEAGVAIVNAILATKGHVVASLEAQAFSMGTILFLAAHEWIVYDNTQLMFHNYSGETWGKGNEIVAHIAAQEKWHREITKNLYMPFLTEEEYERVLEGADLWFHPPEIRKRLNKVVKENKKIVKESEKT